MHFFERNLHVCLIKLRQKNLFNFLYEKWMEENTCFLYFPYSSSLALQIFAFSQILFRVVKCRGGRFFLPNSYFRSKWPGLWGTWTRFKICGVVRFPHLKIVDCIIFPLVYFLTSFCACFLLFNKFPREDSKNPLLTKRFIWFPPRCFFINFTSPLVCFLFYNVLDLEEKEILILFFPTNETEKWDAFFYQ